MASATSARAWPRCWRRRMHKRASPPSSRNESRRTVAGSATLNGAESVLLVERANRVATLTLNRPSVLNAFNDQLLAELSTALRDAERDSEIGALIVTGAGRAFCAGQDLQARREIFERGEVPHLGAGLRDRYKPMIT